MYSPAGYQIWGLELEIIEFEKRTLDFYKLNPKLLMNLKPQKPVCPGCICLQDIKSGDWNWK